MQVPLGDTYYLKFTTRSFSTGAPTTLAGTPVISVYEEGNLTQITAGVTLTVDYDSVTGLHDVAIVATTANGYEAGKYYSAVITTGTVGGVSVVGETVGHFRIMAAEDAGAGIPDVNATHFADTAYATALAAEVDAIWDEPIAGHLTAGTAGLSEALGSSAIVDTTVTGTPTSTTIQLTAGSAIDDFYNDQLLYILSGTGVGQVRVVSDYVGATKTVTVDEAFITTPAAADRVAILVAHTHPNSQIADAVWDEVLTGATHNVTNSAGKRLRAIDAAFEVHSGTAQAGTANTITLDTGASATDNIYRGDRIVIIGGTGVQEHGICISYNGTTKVATMSENWVITPDATSEFEVVPADVDVETWQHVIVSSGATSGLPAVDAQAISDNTAAADNVQANIGNLDAAISSLNNISVSDVLTTQMTEAYAADGVAPTLAQALFLIQQTIGDFSISGTTLTAKKLDGTTTAATYTLDDAVSPTSRTRAT